MQPEKREQLLYARTLSDILHLHRWMGDGLVDLATIYGLGSRLYWDNCIFHHEPSSLAHQYYGPDKK